MRAVRLDQDYHVHATFCADAQSTLHENLREAERQGLRTVCLVDYVSTSSTYVPEHVTAVRALRPTTNIEVLCGIETKMLDRAGHLDMPNLVSVDHVLIADHHFPSETGPLSHGAVRSLLLDGAMLAREAVECLVDASVAAMARVERPVMAHPFSLLPKIGLHESFVATSHLQHFARAARRHGALVEVNEKWSCPGPRLVAQLLRAGVHLVAGSDAHHHGSVGHYPRVRENLRGAHFPHDAAVATSSPTHRPFALAGH